MTRREWNQTLYAIWIECYPLPEWPSLCALHDEEDRGYFEMIEHHFNSNGRKGSM